MPMPQGTKWLEIKQQIAPPRKRVVKSARRHFYEHVAERYQIYLRRQRGEPWPWTKDKVLRDYFFTNTFREHDPGTQWILTHVSDPLGIDPASWQLVVWQVVQYRLPNYPALFEEYGWIPRGFDPKEWLQKINDFEGQWHTTAHITLQSSFKQSRAANYMQYLKELDERFEEFYAGIVGAEGMERAHRHIKRFHGFGNFTAQEVLVDLCLLGVVPPEWRDEWAVAGPGAMEGIDIIYPNRKKTSYLEAMRDLRDLQDKQFARLGLPAPPHLTLHDIQFNLCEFSKRVKIEHGTGRARRYRRSE